MDGPEDASWGGFSLSLNHFRAAINSDLIAAAPIFATAHGAKPTYKQNVMKRARKRLASVVHRMFDKLKNHSKDATALPD